MAKASVVAGVQTGSATSAASEPALAVPTIWKRAVPAIAAAAGKRTSTRSLAGTVTRLPLPAVSVAFDARTATSTASGASVWFCTTTGSSNLSPKLRNRGGDGRTITGSRAVSALSPLPNCLSPATAIAIRR
ncbi:MAG: hypothetical protein IPP06_18755 [Saprospiraceae bacterium]|nr:hypothetical protein [Candidatus Vicinibacter affinis]